MLSAERLRTPLFFYTVLISDKRAEEEAEGGCVIRRGRLVCVCVFFSEGGTKRGSFIDHLLPRPSVAVCRQLLSFFFFFFFFFKRPTRPLNTEDPQRASRSRPLKTSGCCCCCFFFIIIICLFERRRSVRSRAEIPRGGRKRTPLRATHALPCIFQNLPVGCDWPTPATVRALTYCLVFFFFPLV